MAMAVSVQFFRARALRATARRLAGTGAALLFGAALLVGGAQAAGAGTLTFTFSDDGTNSTITVNGSLDLRQSAFGNVSRTDSRVPASDLIRLNYDDSDQNDWRISESNEYGWSQWRVWNITVSGADSFTGGGGKSVDIGASYKSNVYFHFFEASDGSFYLNVDADNLDTDTRTYTVNQETITFDGTLQEVLGDDDFHIEVAVRGRDDVNGDHIQTVVLRTAPKAADKAAEQRILKHSLATVAQATLTGAVDTIGQRFDAAPGAQGLTLAGRRVGGAPVLRAAEGDRWDRIDRWDETPASRSQTLSGSALLRGSAFTLPLAAASDGSGMGSGGPAWTIWGRGDWRTFEGGRRGDSWDGEQWTGWLGVDGRLNQGLMAGVAVSQGESEVDYGLGSRLETSLTALWPYLQMKTAGGGAVSLVVGAGTGEAETRASGGTTEKADLSLRAVSVNGRLPVARMGGFRPVGTGGCEPRAGGDGQFVLGPVARRLEGEQFACSCRRGSGA